MREIPKTASIYSKDSNSLTSQHKTAKCLISHREIQSNQKKKTQS